MNKTELTPRERQARETRRKLIEAGREIFLLNGFQKATISQIIKKANIGYGTAYVYFKNKDVLFIEIMEEIIIKFYEVADLPFAPKTTENAHEQISKQVRLFLECAIEEKEMMLIVKEAIGTSPLVEERWSLIRERFIKRIGLDIKYAQKEQLAKTSFQPEILARGWFYANEMFMWDCVKEDEIELEKIISNLTNMYTGGLYQ
ncbi:TetR/AcrR family transcriptional regulator [Alkalihalobacillus pseudalcaliphilus]|uniref:TetR/AcrR family transcriptional regulator n=1 Tax=Alkalihalobacillus pseudalcaliphilus TaxID=79884 RepID=UPI00064DDAB9|nr:TetR/AcrR family transcriptional regulator [Alkalihalobacillus pseudalcaliphilus]KMK77550.1 TetR family transcriptional regulator [Alkalihalobacillus pseudalcaliphilus]